jgi:hypothetical protein
MPFLPEDFTIPTRLETERFILRPISVDDVEKDMDAVMSSRETLWGMFGEHWGWPAEDLDAAEDRRHLEWHENEFRTRSSFDYAVMHPDESALLGCVYIDPPLKQGYDAEVYLWVRDSEQNTSLEERLMLTVRGWVQREWPFARVVYPGRDLPWEEWDTLPDA